MDCQKAPVLTVLSARDLHGLTFDNLLQVPAELLGKGNHGSVYKVMLNNDVTLAVKRIKDWKFASQEFQKRMCKIRRAKHPNVLPPIAFYCSMQEKLLVYEYQQKGSLFQLLHGSRNDREFGWESRLAVAELMLPRRWPSCTRNFNTIG